jgi:hypothetical protein
MVIPTPWLKMLPFSFFTEKSPRGPGNKLEDTRVRSYKNSKAEYLLLANNTAGTYMTYRG